MKYRYTINAIVSKLEHLAKTNSFVKVFVVLFVWAMATIPTDMYFFLKWVLEPNGFWQKLALLIVWAAVFGWLQVAAIVVASQISFAAVCNEDIEN